MHIKRKYILGFLILAAFAFLYIYTAPSGVYDGDSGELTAVVHTLGLAHSTGFPLYILSGKLFTLIFPFGDVAFRLNVFSGLITALAISLFFLMLLDLELSALASFLAATIFGLGSSIWSNAGVARVYPLAMLCMVILLWIFIRWQKEHKISYIYWYAFIWGLSFGTHLLMLVMIWPFVFMLWAHREQLRKQPKIIWKALGLFAAPFIQYLYIPIAYMRHTPVTWGRIDSLRGFIDYITQRQYTFKMLNRGWGDAPAFFAKVFSLLSSELTILFFFLGLVGLGILYRKNKILCIALLLMSASNIAIMFAYGNVNDIYILYRYLFTAYLVLAVGASYCIATLLRIDTTKWFAVSVILLLIFAEFQAGYARNNRRDNSIVEDTAHNIFQTVEPNSIVFTILDSTFGPLLYLQGHGYRTDVIVVEPELLSVDWYADYLIERYPAVFSRDLLGVNEAGARMQRIIEDNITSRHIYSLFDDYMNPNGEKLSTYFTMTPVGILNKITPRNSDTKMLLGRNEEVWASYQTRGIDSSISQATDENLRSIYSLALNRLGYAYYKNGYVAESIQALRHSLEITSDLSIQQYIQTLESSPFK